MVGGPVPPGTPASEQVKDGETAQLGATVSVRPCANCLIYSCGWRPAQTFQALRFTAGRWAPASSQANALQEAAECEELPAPESAADEEEEPRSGQASR